jgi:hypothetical protein
MLERHTQDCRPQLEARCRKVTLSRAQAMRSIGRVVFPLGRPPHRGTLAQLYPSRPNAGPPGFAIAELRFSLG